MSISFEQIVYGWAIVFGIAALACEGSSSDGGGGTDAGNLTDAGIYQDTGYSTGNANRPEDYLHDKNKTRLVAEIDYMKGQKPRSQVSNDLSDQLSQLVEKPSGVSFQLDQSLQSRGSDYAWSEQELRKLARHTYGGPGANNTIKAHVIFVDGHHEDNDKNKNVLGLALNYRDIIMFKETIEDSCQSNLGGLWGDPCKTAEESIWKHEFGHIFGLVDRGLSMTSNHEDSQHSHHCDNDECVMYWSYNSTDMYNAIGNRFQNGNEDTLEFDQQCVSDMEAVQ